MAQGLSQKDLAEVSAMIALVEDATSSEDSIFEDEKSFDEMKRLGWHLTKVMPSKKKRCFLFASHSLAPKRKIFVCGPSVSVEDSTEELTFVRLTNTSGARYWLAVHQGDLEWVC